MSGQEAGFFVTGANAKVKFGSNTLAYCTDVSYSLDVQTIPIESMGTYEVHANEPVAYAVAGSFSVIRYAKQNVNVSDSGTTDADAANDASGNNMQTVGAFNQLSPQAILGSKTVDLEVHVKNSNDVKAVYKIGDVRCTRKAATLNKRGVLVDNYNFVARLYSDAQVDGTIVESGETPSSGTTVDTTQPDQE